MAVAFAGASLLAAGILLALGHGEHGTDVALQATGRLSFLLFLPAYAGGSISGLCPSIFGDLKRYRRDFGLAFASAHLVHLGLVTWLCLIGAAPGLPSFVFFGIAVMWTYVLAILSVGRLERAIGHVAGRLIGAVGLNYIAFAFATDFIRLPNGMDVRYLVGYLPFMVLAIAGPVFRLCAIAQWLVPQWRARRRCRQQTAPGHTTLGSSKP